MGDNSKIDWTDATWNPLAGCTKVSPGCAHCYAEIMANRLKAMGNINYQGVVDEQGRWSGQIALIPSALEQPLHWKRPRMIFVDSMSDLFHPTVPSGWINKVFEVMMKAKWHTFQVLTKRPERMAEFLNGAEWWINAEPESRKHIWLGASIENQRMARKRIPILQNVSAEVRFLSCEPMLGWIDLSEAVEPDKDAWDEVNAYRDDDDEPEEFVEECEAELDWVNFGNDLVENPAHREWERNRQARAGFKTLKHGVIDWVICGGESGPKARPMNPDWAKWLRNECKEAGIPFFFKQWGEWAPAEALQISDNTTFKHQPVNISGTTMMYRVGKQAAGHVLDGVEWRQMPNDRDLDG